MNELDQPQQWSQARVTRTSNLTATMIANDLIDRNDDRERLIVTMVMQMIDFGRNDDRKQSRCLTAMKIVWTHQSTSSIAKTFATMSKGINCKQEAHAIATVGKLDWPQQCLREQAIVVMVARPNHHDSVCKSKQLQWGLQEQQMIAKITSEETCMIAAD